MNILTLSGWTQPSNAIASHIDGALSFDYSEYATPEAAIEALQKYDDVSMVIGWSMGGWLAMQAIAAGALKPNALLLLAPPFQFVNDARFRDGMAPPTFDQFRQNYITDPARTSSRFHGLVAKGDRDMRGIMDRLSHHPDVTDTVRWLPWLDELSTRSLHDIAITVPRMALIHGDGDAIVPVAQSAHIVDRHPGIESEIWQNACHAPHLHDTGRFLEKVRALYAN